jgi:nucleotide-binding universal stress UspA family protein
MRTILVGFDDTGPSRAALARAAHEATTAHGELLVLAVLELPVDPLAPRAFGTAGDGEPLTGPFPEPPEITRVLEAAREALEGTGTRARYVWAPGDPAEIIIGAAKAHEADLIVLGEPHHGLLARLLGADVAADLRRQAGCEVLIAEADDPAGSG